MTSRLDSRFAGYQLDAGATNTSFDYSNANIEDCFLTAFEAYIRNDLNYKNDGLYYVAGNAPPWSGEYNTVVNMETGFAKNPHMHLFVGMGYYCLLYTSMNTKKIPWPRFTARDMDDLVAFLNQ